MIDLVLSDDWELRGNGSGNMRRIQFETMRQLMDLYESYGFRGTFNVEVMQQLAHLSVADGNRDFKLLVTEWETCVLEAYSRGHDIQLHIHPQWSQAAYKDGTWVLGGAWNICTYGEAEIRRFISSCSGYLNALIQRVDPQYRCVAFRGGAWGAAPSPSLFPALIDAGITLDMSMVGGLHYDLPIIKLDYRHIDESFLPYYPILTDARRIAPDKQRVICAPTFSFSSRKVAVRALMNLLSRRFGNTIVNDRYKSASSYPIVGSGSTPNYSAIWNVAGSGISARIQKLLRNLMKGQYCVADIAQLSPFALDIMLRNVAERAKEVGDTIVVLTNHTKDIGSFVPIRYFCDRLAQESRTFHVVTASEAAANLWRGKYTILGGGDK